MIRILVVEDENEKRRLLVETLLSVGGISHDHIHYAGDARAAKNAIKAYRYELVILDINIPSSPDQQTETGGGLAVLSYIRNNVAAKPPAFLVGMTAYDDGMSAAAEAFTSPLWKLVKFSYTEMTWQAPLKAAIELLLKRDAPPYVSDGRTYHTDIGIFVALEDDELLSIRQIDAGWSERKLANDHARYFEGTFHAAARDLKAVAVAAPKMGLSTAAVISTKLIQAYRPKYLVIAGICAGVRDKVELGDILVADPCFDWGSGKWMRDGDGNVRFRPAPYPWRLDEQLRIRLKEFGEDKKMLKSIYDDYTGPKPAVPPVVYIDAMASGGSVLQVAQLMDDVREQHKNLIGVEMESYATFTAAEYAEEPRPQCFSAKVVCDFGDEDKNNDAHAYAAYVSAQFVYRFSLKFLSESDL